MVSLHGQRARSPGDSGAVRRGCRQVRHHAREGGRDPDGIALAYSANWYSDQEAEGLPNGARRPLTGTPAQIVDDIKRYEEVASVT